MDFPLLKTNMEVRGGGPLSGIARDTPDPARGKDKKSKSLELFPKRGQVMMSARAKRKRRRGKLGVQFPPFLPSAGKWR